MTDLHTRLTEQLARHGLLIRGGLHASEDRPLPEAQNGKTGQTLLLIGHDSQSLWPAFAEHADEEDHPLDRWTRRVMEPIADEIHARAYYPSDKPYQPFLSWSLAAEPVWSSPLGMLIHAEYGLFHAYRAALVFAETIALPERVEAEKPCMSCQDQPCLSACPVGAFSDDGYDVEKCAGYLRTSEGRACLEHGCKARRACPVGEPYRPAQAAFHMRAFLRSR